MKLKSNAFLRSSRIAIATFPFALTVAPLLAQTTWDGGGNADINVSTKENWNNDTAPPFNGTTAASFGSVSGNEANINTAAFFSAITFNRTSGGFTLSDGGASLKLKASTSGGTKNLTVSTSLVGTAVIDTPLVIDKTLGGSLFVIQNNKATTLDINGALSGLATAPTTNDFQLRYEGVASSITRIDGTISNLTNVQQASGVWAGDLVFGADQSLAAAAITISSGGGFGTPTAAGRLILGETSDDEQTWGNITLNNVMNLSIGGTITAGSLSGSGAAKVTGYSATNGVLSLTGGSPGATVMIGGSGTNENNLNLVKTSAADTLTLASANTYTGSTTVTAGTLRIGVDSVGSVGSITSSAVGTGTIVFNGGKVSASNTSSARTIYNPVTFTGDGHIGDSTNFASLTFAADVDLGGAVRTIQTNGTQFLNGIISNGGITKTNSGILVLAGTNTYNGATNINTGTLRITGTLASGVTLNTGGTLDGEGSTSASLTFGTGASTLKFDQTTATASFTAATVAVSGTPIVTVSPFGSLVTGNTYTVLKVTGGFGSVPLATFTIPRGTLAYVGNELQLTATVGNITWKGNDLTNPSFWDTNTTTNWLNGASPDKFVATDNVTFDDNASSFVVDVQGASVSPGNVVFNNTTSYTLNGGGIAGTGSLSKSGSGLLTLANTSANTFSGGLDVTAGVLAFSAVNQLGSTAVPIDLNVGTLRFNAAGSSVSDSLALTLGASGGTIDCTTFNTTFRLGGKISGTGNLLKTGSGTLALGKGNNTDPLNDFSGTITVTGGALDIRHANSLGESDADSETSIQSATLLMQNFGQTTGSTIEVPEQISFSGISNWSVLNQENKAFTDRFTGPVSVSGTLNISSAITTVGQVPGFEINGPVTTNLGTTLAFGVQGGYPLTPVATAQNIVVGGTISGPGSVTAQGDAGSVYTLSAPGYSGNTTVNSGTLKLGAANTNNESSTINVASGGKIDIAFSGNDTVAALVLGGNNMLPGTYSFTTHPAFFAATGSGSIVVTTPAGGYSAWRTANAPGQTVDQDHDHDGVDNGIEYFMGLSGNAFTANPAVSGNSVTWTKGASYSGVYGNQFSVQTSTDLTTWSNAPLGTNPGEVNIAGNNITYTLPTGAGETFVRLKVNAD
jgi:autotransporter-associated beta strand protein